MLALIALVALSLAAVGLMRTMLATNQVAGNLAFQQSAAQAAQVGVETAMAWLDQQARAFTEVVPASGALPAQLGQANRLSNHILKGASEPIAYRATRQDPIPGQSWEAFWAVQKAANFVNELPPDANGNKVSYLIHRLCVNQGKRESMGSNCELAPYRKVDERGSMSSPTGIPAAREALYRITVRVEGPRNAVSFTQTIISI
ncbi:hypothetical protein [Inhella proteolytica]|uniref:Type IV pilus assembly protein PilX n=1 Tax=Inhella proteolytica TaxID=2795029 RepID=A0A931NH06_9BURK|nr:hypothetical protein [Inhella proteolytica]MBH9576005.1 hypothetical protein [Inhella proteolytica]